MKYEQLLHDCAARGMNERVRRLVLAAILSCSALAHAQLVLEDDFESALLKPPGRWDRSFTGFPGQVLAIVPSAAHAGSLGLRFDDQHADAGTMNNMFVVADSVLGSEPQYVRAWWRTTPSAASTIQTLVNLNIDSAISSGVELKWRSGTNTLLLVCHDASSAAVLGPATSVVVPDGGFHLVEVAATGMGTSSGECLFAIDGVEVTRAPLDWTARRHLWVSVGPSPADLEWTGQMDFDDFAADVVPQASHLVVLDGGALQVGECGQVAIGFQTSFGVAGPSRVDDVVRFQLDGGEGFLDSQCTTPAALTGIPAPEGANTVDLWVRPSVPGRAALELDATDVLGTRALLTVLPAPPDAGSPDAGPGSANPHGLLVGCGCTSLGSAGGWGLVLVVLRARRRRGVSASPSNSGSPVRPPRRSASPPSARR